MYTIIAKTKFSKIYWYDFGWSASKKESRIFKDRKSAKNFLKKIVSNDKLLPRMLHEYELKLLRRNV